MLFSRTGHLTAPELFKRKQAFVIDKKPIHPTGHCPDPYPSL